MIPGEQRVPPNSGSFQTTVPVSGLGMENRPWKPPVANRRLLCFFKQNCSCQLERSQSLAVVHTPCLCDDKIPDHAWLHAISKLTPGPGRANPHARLGVRWCMRDRGNLSAAMETDLAVTITRGSQDTRRVSISARLQARARSAQVGLRRWTDSGIGTISHARIHNNVFFFLVLR